MEYPIVTFKLEGYRNNNVLSRNLKRIITQQLDHFFVSHHQSDENIQICLEMSRSILTHFVCTNSPFPSERRTLHYTTSYYVNTSYAKQIEDESDTSFMYILYNQRKKKMLQDTGNVRQDLLK